jgi:hypothetical protein
VQSYCIGKVAGFAVSTALMSAAFGFLPANAQTTVPAAGCFIAPAKLPNADIQAFLASPPALLTRFPSGGLTLSSQVRALAGSSADALAPLLALAKQGSPSQAAAIGAGLARVARSCVSADPQYVAQIQADIADIKLADLETAFTAGLNETQTAAIGGGAGGGGGAAAGGASAIGGGGASNGGASTAADGSSSTPTTVQTFSLRSRTATGTTTSTTTTIIREISCSTPTCS